MKKVLGILLILSSMNIANAACTKYTDIAFVDDGFGHSLTNVVVEGFEYQPRSGLHSITVNLESVDCVGNALTCMSFRYSKISPNATDDLALEEFLKLLKLSMTLGYKLEINSNIISGPSYVSVTGLTNLIISKP